jgi:hypothetical protein
MRAPITSPGGPAECTQHHSAGMRVGEEGIGERFLKSTFRLM